MSLLGHYFTHQPGNLARIGVSEELLLKYVNDRFPRTEDGFSVPPSDCSIAMRLDELFQYNTDRNDGLTLFLLFMLTT